VHTPFVDGFLKKYYPDENDRMKNLMNFQSTSPLAEWENPMKLPTLPLFSAPPMPLSLPGERMILTVA
jgi:hypothetical protein